MCVYIFILLAAVLRLNDNSVAGLKIGTFARTYGDTKLNDGQLNTDGPRDISDLVRELRTSLNNSKFEHKKISENEII